MSETTPAEIGSGQVPDKARPGQITAASGIKIGNQYLLFGLNGRIVRPVTVLEGPHISKEHPRLGQVVLLKINYSQKELEEMAVPPQTRMTLPLRDIGIIPGQRARLETSLWLAHPEESAKES